MGIDLLSCKKTWYCFKAGDIAVVCVYELSNRYRKEKEREKSIEVTIEQIWQSLLSASPYCLEHVLDHAPPILPTVDVNKRCTKY